MLGGEYHTQMDVKESAALELPITITTNGEQVELDLHNVSVPPYCGQTNYVSVGGPPNAINLEGQSHIVIDGQDWSGIIISGIMSG